MGGVCGIARGGVGRGAGGERLGEPGSDLSGEGGQAWTHLGNGGGGELVLRRYAGG